MSALVAVQGRIRADIDVRETRNGNKMAMTRIQAMLPHRDSGASADKPWPWWIGLLAFGAAAEALALCERGDGVAVSGRLQHSAYKGRQGEEREGWTIIVDSVFNVRAVADERRGAAPPPTHLDEVDPSDDIPW